MLNIHLFSSNICDKSGKIENRLGATSEPKLISICFKFLGIIYQDLTWEDEKGLETGQKASMTQHQSDQIRIFNYL